MKYILILVVSLLLTVSSYFSYRSLETIQALNQRVSRTHAEYQLIISDSAQITIFDQTRYVGTVKLEGQLDSLLIDDNQ